MIKLICRVTSLFLLWLILRDVAAAAIPLGPATWGFPDQPWGRRRPVTQVDQAAITMYRSGQVKPSFSVNFGDPAELQSDWLIHSDDELALKSCRTPASVVVGIDGLNLKTLPVTGHRAKWSTGYIWSKFRQKYGFFECKMKAARGQGLNNAFWLTTNDNYEIDITEIRYPNYSHMTLHRWVKPFQSVGFARKFVDNFGAGFHDFGLLWTPASIVFEADGQPVAAMDITNAIEGTADVRLSTALADFAGKVPANPAGLNMTVKSVRVFPVAGAAK
jgi:hypothetical protein